MLTSLLSLPLIPFKVFPSKSTCQIVSKYALSYANCSQFVTFYMRFFFSFYSFDDNIRNYYQQHRIYNYYHRNLIYCNLLLASWRFSVIVNYPKLLFVYVLYILFQNLLCVSCSCSTPLVHVHRFFTCVYKK